MWGGKHYDLYMRSDVFVQNITAICTLLIMCRQKYGDGVGGLTVFSRLLVFCYLCEK